MLEVLAEVTVTCNGGAFPLRSTWIRRMLGAAIWADARGHDLIGDGDAATGHVLERHRERRAVRQAAVLGVHRMATMGVLRGTPKSKEYAEVPLSLGVPRSSEMKWEKGGIEQYSEQQ